jgi:tetratricopeptide (TPR) repeat protein
VKNVACGCLLISFLLATPLFLEAAKENTWIEIRSPHFTVFSDAGEEKARSVAHEFEKFHAVIGQFMPSIQSGPSIPPIILAAENEKTLRSLLPEFWEEKGLVQPSGIFVGGPEKNYVALRLDMDDDYRYHVIYHEYVHLLIRLNYPPLPTWLEEGLAECFGYTAISDDSSNVGRASPVLLNILQNRQPLSISELFAVDSDSPYYREESKSSIFYAQSWALTHLLLLGDKAAHAPKLWKFLELIQNNVPKDKAAAQAFGDLKELERRLNEYILQLGFYSYKVKTPSIQEPEEYVARVVPSIEIRTLKGDFFVSTKRWTEAKEMLDSVLAEDPQNPEALTSMGVYYVRQNQPEEARKYFLEAAHAGSKSCITHYYVGITALQMKEYQKAETFFREAIRLNSRFAPAYAALAEALAMREETTGTALKLAMQAVKLEPGVLSHQLNLANVLMNLGQVDRAIEYGEEIEAAAESLRDHQDAKHFLLLARRYRDDLRGMELITEEADSPPRERVKQGMEYKSLPGFYQTGIDGQEATEKALEKAENERQRLLKERETAFNRRAKAEREYSEKVDAARSKSSGTLEGTVFMVNCVDPAVMEIMVETGGTRSKFHVSNYFDTQFRAVDYEPDGGLNPCTDLIGRRVTIKFIATPDAAYAGEIQDLGIYKSAR